MSELLVHIPSHVTKTVEALLGVSLARVRVRLSGAPEAIGAQAFAFGDDIYVAPNAYRPDTYRGVELLAHELVHVAQQRLGLTGIDSTLFSEVDLEDQAALFGRIGAAFAVTGWIPSKPLVTLPRSGSPTTAVQCLMSDADFKQATNAWGSRDKIKPVDAALAAFHKLNVGANKDYSALLAQVQAIYKACNDYKTVRPKSDRLPGVERLIKEVHLESSMLDSLSKWQKETNLIHKFDNIQDARELWRKLDKRPEFTKNNYWNEIDKLTNDAINSIRQSPGLMEQTLLRELNDLKDIAGENGTPEIIKKVILECVTPGNCQQISLKAHLPGAKYNMTRGGGVNTKYTLNHLLNQSMGKKFRLGSLLHELTHISIAETFGFTVIMLAADPNAKDDALLALARQRRAHIASLRSAISDDRAIDPDLKNEMDGKAQYPISGKFVTYVTSFRNQMDPATYARLTNLKTRGLDCELIEYDTVINQMMLWCHLYGVDPANEVYRKLQILAEIAYNYRSAHRRSKRVVVTPASVARLARRDGRRMSI